MITRMMKKWLANLPDEPELNLKYFVYMHRIQKRINRLLDDLYWLCKTNPDVFLNKEEMGNERMKQLLFCVKKINPHCNVELVIRNLRDSN